jgi:uncharacterized protein YhfF
VLAREKTATAGLHGEEPTPAAGDRFLLQDAQGTPRAIVEVTEIRVLPAAAIDVRFARDEGEGFESVQDWHRAHEDFFRQPILPQTLIDAIRFRVVRRL